MKNIDIEKELDMGKIVWFEVESFKRFVEGINWEWIDRQNFD